VRKSTARVALSSGIADVVAKEIVHVFDGETMTRYGRLIMGAAAGRTFNLMGLIPADSQPRVTSDHTRSVLKTVEKQTRARGLEDLKEYRAFSDIQDVEFWRFSSER
jgi:hypothetical protein